MQGLVDGWRWIFQTSGFVVRGGCGGWTVALLNIHNLSDLAIGMAYLVIPALGALFWFRLERKPKREGIILALFAAFISFCGLTHLLGVASSWWPAYRFIALIKVLTGILSWVTALVLVPIIPRVLREVADPRPRATNANGAGRMAEATKN